MKRIIKRKTQNKFLEHTQHIIKGKKWKGIMGSKQKQTKKRSRCDFQNGHWPRLSSSPPTENQYSPFNQLHHMSTGGLRYE